MTQQLFNSSAQLEETLREFIRDFDTEMVLDRHTRDWMSRRLSSFVISAVDQFIEGQKKYKTDFLRETDHGREATRELCDLLWYISGMDWNLNK